MFQETDRYMLNASNSILAKIDELIKQIKELGKEKDANKKLYLNKEITPQLENLHKIYLEKERILQERRKEENNFGSIIKELESKDHSEEVLEVEKEFEEESGVERAEEKGDRSERRELKQIERTDEDMNKEIVEEAAQEQHQ